MTEEAPDTENRRRLVKQVLGWILVVVGVPMSILVGLFGVLFSPSFSPEEMDRMWRQSLAIFLIGLSLVLCGGVILFSSRKRKRGLSRGS